MNRTCTKCGETKHAEEFAWSNKPKGYRRSYCKECQKAMNQAKKIKDPDYFNRASRESYARNPEQRRQRRKEYYWDNSERERAYQREYYQEHIEAERAKNLEYYYAHKEEMLAYALKWRDEHREEIGQYCREYRANNPQVHRDSERKRRALKKTDDAELIRFAVVFERDRGICHLCWQVCSTPTIDHVIPLNGGGSHRYDNVKLACLSCNCRKSDDLIPSGAYANLVAA